MKSQIARVGTVAAIVFALGTTVRWPIAAAHCPSWSAFTAFSAHAHYMVKREACQEITGTLNKVALNLRVLRASGSPVRNIVVGVRWVPFGRTDLGRITDIAGGLVESQRTDNVGRATFTWRKRTAGQGPPYQRNDGQLVYVLRIPGHKADVIIRDIPGFVLF